MQLSVAVARRGGGGDWSTGSTPGGEGRGASGSEDMVMLFVPYRFPNGKSPPLCFTDFCCACTIKHAPKYKAITKPLIVDRTHVIWIASTN